MLAEDLALTRYPERAQGASLMDGRGTLLLHIVEVVTAPSPRRARRQPTHVVHRECRHRCGWRADYLNRHEQTSFAGR